MKEQDGLGSQEHETLAEALRLVSRDDREAAVSPQVRIAVMQAWDARVPDALERHRSHRRHLRAGALAAAACAVLAAALWLPRPAERTTGTRAPVGVVPEMAAATAEPYSLASIAATEVLLQDDPASLQVVRLTVPPSTLAALGYAYANPLDTEPVSVEVLIGLDGVPRAIRRLEGNPVLEY